MPGPVISIQIVAATQEALQQIQQFIQAIHQGFDQAAQTLKTFATEAVAAFSVSEQAESSNDPGAKIAEDLTKASEKQAEVQTKLDDLNADTFYSRLHRNIAQLTNEWGNMAGKMADVITGTVTSAVHGLSNALASVIMGSQSAAQAFTQFGVQMLTSFIANVIQMILMAQVAIPILTALGVLSGGSIPAAGSITTVAAVGTAVASTAAYTYGFAEGGTIRLGSGPRADDVMVRASRGEYVLTAAAVNYYGEAFISALNQRMVSLRDIADAIPRGVSRPIARGTYADGGYVDQGTAAGSVTVNPSDVHIGILKNQDDLREFLASRDGRKMIIDIVSGSKHELGIRS